MNKATDFEVVDLGVDYSDYFQGFGCSCTQYEFARYGTGDTPREALDDCLEHMADYAMADTDVEDLYNRIIEQYPDFAKEEQPSATEDMAEEEIDDCENLPYWHIGIRWNID